MSLSISIDKTELDQVATLIGGVATRADKLKPAHDKALFAVMSDVDERFNSAPALRSSALVYGKVIWPRLTEEYLQYRSVERELKSGQILRPRLDGQQLRDTGELLQSFQIGKSGNVTETTKDGWAFGSALPKARGLRHKRPLIFFHAQLIEVLINIYAQYLTGDLK